jgi:nucleotide-binding universal stress UspA family protein
MGSYEIKNILVPTDFSDLSFNAITTAIGICERQNALMVLAHVIEVNQFKESSPFVGLLEYLGQLTDYAKSMMEKIETSIKENHKIKVTSTITTGNISDNICMLAEKREADLIVMGTHGISGVREFFIGSTSFRVVKYAPCPVMTVPSEGEWKSFKKILFPVRITPGALEKYDFIRPIISKNNAQLVVLGIANDYPREKITKVIEMVDQLRDRLTEDGVKTEIKYSISNKIAERVLAAAKKNEVDLIVITASLDKSLKNLFVGPYAQQIVNHARVPILSILPVRNE